MKRNKTKFEKWFSLSRHKRRNQASVVGDELINIDFDYQKTQIITGNEITYTHGSAQDVLEHCANLRSEFIGSSELCLTHAKLIVLIRREFKEKYYFTLFEELWNQEQKHLIKNLNTRWLIAAADTFADYSSNPKTQALALSCALLINTLKIIETERLINESQDNILNVEIINRLQNEERIALFDGTSAFAVGTDDTLRNMRYRIDKIHQGDIVGSILLEIWKRINTCDTVYARFKQLHTRDKTNWWE